MSDRIEYPIHYNGVKLETVVPVTNNGYKDLIIKPKTKSTLQFPCFPYLK